MNPTTSSQALQSLQNFKSGAKSQADILAEQQAKFGVNEAQQNVQGLRGAVNATTKILNQIAPSVMGRTANSLVTSAQANKQIQNEQAPVASTLTQQTTDLGNSTQDLNTAEQQALQAANAGYEDQQGQLSYLQNIYNILYQQERDAEAARVAEEQRQEAIRQFNEQLKASRASSGANLSPSFSSGVGGSVASQTDPNAALKNKAYTDVTRFLNSNRSDASKQQEIDAIRKSAGFGNTYDQLKLQVIQALNPKLKVSAPKPAPKSKPQVRTNTNLFKGSTKALGI